MIVTRALSALLLLAAGDPQGHATAPLSAPNSLAKTSEVGSAKDIRIEVPYPPTSFIARDERWLSFSLASPRTEEPLRLEPVVQSGPAGKSSGPAGERLHLAYELVITNSGRSASDLRRLEISGNAGRPSIATFEGEALQGLLAFPERRPSGIPSSLSLGPKERVVVNLFLTLPRDARIPRVMRHRLITSSSTMDLLVPVARASDIPTLGPPLRGGNWFVLGGPGGTGPMGYHRANTFPLDGHLEAARRYAIDWVKISDARLQRDGKPLASSYYSYGEDVLAVADAVVETALDGIKDNTPGQVPNSPPITPVCEFCGNHVVLKLAEGRFATYMHLKPGTMRVRTGNRVRRGQVLGQVGNSGDSFLPHLHFHVATEPGMTGQGLPYLIDQFGIVDERGVSHPSVPALPLDGTLVSFGD